MSRNVDSKPTCAILMITAMGLYLMAGSYWSVAAAQAPQAPDQAAPVQQGAPVKPAAAKPGSSQDAPAQEQAPAPPTTPPTQTNQPVSLPPQPQVLAIAPQPEVPKIQVVIVGVPSWNHLTLYKDNALGGNIQDACREIETFFQGKFGDRVEFHPDIGHACTDQATTYSAIRKLLYVDMPSFGKGTLTFLFMMSHGEEVKYENKFLETDTEFITSDATDGDEEEKSLSIGIELINWMSKMPAGSTVLAFVDTCHSGAVDSLALSLDEGVKNYMGLRFGLMVSSLSNQGTYAAAFTRSLLKLWKDPTQCPVDIPNWLHNQVNQMLGNTLTTFDAQPKVVVDYKGSWCLNELGTQGQLLFLYQGEVEDVAWTITQVEDPSKIFHVPPTGKSPFEFTIVPPGHYKVTAQTKDTNQSPPWDVDLVQNSTYPIFLNYPDTQDKALRALNAWVDHAKFRGVSAADTAKVEAAASFVSKALNTDLSLQGNRIELAEELEGVGNETDQLRSLGAMLVRHGNFRDAARVLAKAAEVTNDATVAKEAATDALLAAGAAGDFKTAHTLDMKYDLDLGPAASQTLAAVYQARKEKSHVTVDQLRSISAVQLATGHYHFTSVKYERAAH